MNAATTNSSLRFQNYALHWLALFIEDPTAAADKGSIAFHC